MVSKTRGIVLHRFKYSESSIIAKIYTEQYGLQSFLIQGARKKTSTAKAGLLHPLSLIELVAYHKETSGLQKMREMKNNYPLLSINNDITKTTIAIFLSEMLVRSIREETPNKEKFKFIYESVKKLDETKSPVNFHLLFLLKLSKLLGFYPQGEYSEQKPFFNLPEGIFVSEIPHHSHFLPPASAKFLWQLMCIEFNDLHKLTIDGKTRKELLEKIIDYYRLHLTGLQEIKSHRVLETVLRD